MMKIKACEVFITWEDGERNEVSSFLPEYTWRALEEFMDYWEERYGDNKKEEEDEEGNKNANV